MYAIRGYYELEDRRDAVGIMGGELRIDPVAQPEELLREADIAHVGRDLGGEKRKARQPLDLRALHFRVPEIMPLVVV